MIDGIINLKKWNAVREMFVFLNEPVVFRSNTSKFNVKTNIYEVGRQLYL
jgi:hypothetical protein